MNWEAVGAIAEAIASIGVIISLVYLAVQNRKQSVKKGLRVFESLDPSEKRQLLAIIQSAHRRIEKNQNENS